MNKEDGPTNSRDSRQYFSNVQFVEYGCFTSCIQAKHHNLSHLKEQGYYPTYISRNAGKRNKKHDIPHPVARYQSITQMASNREYAFKKRQPNRFQQKTRWH